MNIRKVQKTDKDQWLSLWQGYLDFYKAQVADDVTQSVWDRLFDDSSTIEGYVAEKKRASYWLFQ